MKTYRTQTKSIAMAAGVADTTLTEADVSLDRNFDRCIGIAAVEKVAQAAAFYELGVRSPRGAELDLAGSSLLYTGSSVAPDMKFKSVNIPVVDGELLTVQLKNSSGAVAPAGGFSTQYVFLLERDEAKQ